MAHEGREIAIISGVHFGLRDCGRPVLSFIANCHPCTGSLQIVELDDLKDFLTKDADGKPIYIEDIKSLEGHPVIVESDGGYVRMKGLWKP